MWPTQQGPVLCLVTDRRRLTVSRSDDTQPLVDLIAAAADAGVDLVHIREGDLDDRALTRLVTRAVAVTSGSETQVVVNDRYDIALAGGAAGVHLKESSAPAERVRPLVPSTWLVGRSIHSVSAGRQVTAIPGLDYVVLGTILATESKPDRSPIGLVSLREAAEVLPVPVLAIGGITLDSVPEIAKTGVAGLAAIGLFADLANSTPQEFRRCVDKIRKRWQM